MQKGKLSYYSAAVLGLLGVFFLISLGLSFSGTENSPGNFLKESFTYASFFIPLYIFAGAVISFKEKFKSRWVILLTSTIGPFLTSVLFLKVYFDIDNSLPVVFTVNLLGRKEGSFLLFLLFLVEILLIYILSIRMSRYPDTQPEKDISIPTEPNDEIKETAYSGNTIMRPGISAELLGTSFMADPVSETKEQPKENLPVDQTPHDISVVGEIEDVDLPELLSLEKLESLGLRDPESPKIIESSKDISIEFGEDYVEELEEPQEIDDTFESKVMLETIDFDEEYVDAKENNDTEFGDEVFSEIGTDHLINADIPDDSINTEPLDEPPMDKDIKT
ncbi:MAG: hypothetical protein KAH95_17040, partial [Spirochaetales bacterium]|nr:hypothetical protein [Spirochaetales bacterium]